ncbi:inositol-3-phosphate synthase [Streptomyces sp. NEAU-W12]|uniref:inositol-3-phosphate synthase n=1 Tax=Streptomyces sp. NEAU-W12 TaxID=2994668 RepID=UPI00224ADB3A|nr:inositol-3-phosphate synthase [Streptomyces sp. NEAU-W12]MCX2928005.1 inositol-3-phosphate synthase [Streptomyces sp. NEAU-W12]
MHEGPAEARSARHKNPETTTGRLGAAVVGLGGAVATTAVAGVELLKLGTCGRDGLPLASRTDLVPYEDLVFGGWDMSADDLAKAAHLHRVLEPAQIEAAAARLQQLRPWPAVADPAYCRAVTGAHVVPFDSPRERTERIREDLRRFRDEQGLDEVVVVNLASTERLPDTASPALASPEAFEAALDTGDGAITPAMLYAYAALREGMAYLNFTPSCAADVPALIRLAERQGVPIAGKDGKTGQTMVKTVLAPALRSRALRVEGWYSTNLLGNRDGRALEDPDSMASKTATKESVLDAVLGYPVEDHQVRIEFYRPRGDEKEAWDNIDLVGFLGRRMQMKIDFLCRDSVLAAPLVLELIRLLAEARRRGERGVQEQFGFFFKAPMTADGSVPEHALHRQEQALLDWLDGRGRTTTSGRS